MDCCVQVVAQRAGADLHECDFCCLLLLLLFVVVCLHRRCLDDCSWLYFLFPQMGPDLFTLATAMFDLNNCSVTIVTGNPKTDPVLQAVWTVSPCSKQ